MSLVTYNGGAGSSPSPMYVLRVVITLIVPRIKHPRAFCHSFNSNNTAKAKVEQEAGKQLGESNLLFVMSFGFASSGCSVFVQSGTLRNG